MIKKILKQFIYMMIPIKNNRITIIDETKYSGSNCTALYEYILEHNINNEYEIKVFTSEKDIDFNSKIKNMIYKVSSSVLITTHSILKYKKNQNLIQLWHGIPLKSMGLLDNTYSQDWIKNDKYVFDNLTNIISTSEFYKTLLNSTIGQPSNKYILTGYPRNDFLLENKPLNLKYKFKDLDENNKSIFYVPTFKKGYAGRCEGNSRDENFFGLDKFNIEEFSKFLQENRYNLFLKLHPFEEQYYKEELKKKNIKNIYFIDSEFLNKNGTDLYKWLGNSDMLITDYSSVYFDYLLTEKPILFINPDEDEYRKVRGFLLEPYKFWTPGPKVQAQVQLEQEIKKLLDNKNYYLNERLNMLNIFHTFKDQNSCERVWNFIEHEYLNK